MSQPKITPERNPARVPTLPVGVEIASFGTYLEAQRAVDHLSDKAFAVQALTIVGDDLKMVERVTGRLTYGRVVFAGLLSGAWFGLFVGLLLTMFAPGGEVGVSLVAAIVLGAGFGALFSLISYALTGGKRDFTSQSQIVASRYSVLCKAEQMGQARQLLAEAGIRSTAGPAVAHLSPSQSVATQQEPTQQSPWGQQAPVRPGVTGADTAQTQPAGANSAPSPTTSARSVQYLTADGRPRYGVRVDDTAARPVPDAATKTESDPQAASGDTTATSGDTPTS